jgi:diadenosine tetraphosphate (Ap4A) HIT family hydrolase
MNPYVGKGRIENPHCDLIQPPGEDDAQALLGHLMLVARDMGKKMGLEGYKLTFNVGKKGGQEIFHIHLHLMATND